MPRCAAAAELASGILRTLLELAFAWLLAQDAVVSVIAGAPSPEQIGATPPPVHGA